MNRIKYFFILISVLFPAAITMANGKSLEAVFIGNEAFRITDGEHILLTDFPYKSGVYDSMEYEFYFPGTQKNTLSLITHRHADHFAPLLFLEQDWKIIGPPQATLPLDQSKLLKFGPEMTFGSMTITPKNTLHANIEHYSYLVTWQGKRMFFTGDTEELSAFEGLPELDALFISPWFYRKAKQNDKLPEAKKIIIYHHKDNEIVPGCVSCIIPIQGQKITFE